MPEPAIFGVMAEFETARDILAAVRQARAAGYRDVEAYTPYPVEGLAEELGSRSTRIPFVVFVGGVIGATVGYFMQYWSMAVDYPFDVGGRPPNSWPAYIPITFEVMILVAAFSALFGMIYLNGLPRFYRPLFNVPQFDRVTTDRFFLCIEATDPLFDRERARQFLAGLHPVEVTEVPQ